MEIASAFVSILPSFKGTASSLGKQMSPEVNKSGKSLGSSFGSVFAKSVAVVGGTAAIGGFLKGSIAEAREAQKVGAQTNAVLKSTGGVAGITAAQVGKLAGAISLKTGIDDEAIQSGENLLLTFTNIRNAAGKNNDVFNQATKIATDMSAALGQDMKSSAIQVGKALNDPVKGVTALSRVGVSFTAQQKDQIKTLVASGHTMQAQKLILGELNKEFGGSAAASATAGDKFKVAFGNLQETIGTALLPVVDKVANTMTTKVIPAISGFITQMQNGTGVGGQVASAFQTFGNVLQTVGGFIKSNADVLLPLVAAIGGGIAVVKTISAVTRAWAAVQAALNIVLSANPIGIVVVAIGALVAGLVVAYKRSETFRNIVNGAFRVVKTVVSSVVGWFGKYVPQIFGVVVSAVKIYINVYKTVITTAFNLVRSIVTAVMGTVRSVVTSVWNAVKTAFTTAGSAIRGVLTGLGTAVGKFLTAVRDKFGDAVTFLKGIPGKIVDAVGDLGRLLYDKGRDLIQGLIDGIGSMAGAIGDAVGGVLDAIPGVGKILPKVSLASPSSLASTSPIIAEPSIAASGMSLTAVGSTAGVAQLEAIRRELVALRAVTGVQGREFGREINGAVAKGHRRRV